MEHAWPPAWIEVPMRWAVWVAVRALPPRGRGLRIAGAIDRLLPPSGRLFRAPLPGAFAISCDLRDPVQGCVFYRGLYEPEVVACLNEALRPGDVFLDIGANVGFFASIAGRRIGITGRVLAIEPAKDLAARLRSDVSAAGRRAAHVEVLEVALGDSSRDGTLLDVAGLNRAGERSLSVDEAGAAHGMHVRVCPLDELLPDLCFDVARSTSKVPSSRSSKEWCRRSAVRNRGCCLSRRLMTIYGGSTPVSRTLLNFWTS